MGDDALIPQRHSRMWLDMLRERETHSINRVNYRTMLPMAEDWQGVIVKGIEDAIAQGRSRREEHYRSLRLRVDRRECVANVCIRALGALR